METVFRVEFHCHTQASRDCLSPVDRLIEIARIRGIQRLVITDHNQIQGALEAKKLDPELVIVGEEVLTTRGELLAAFVEEVVPRGLEPREAIHRLREQGAFISVSHPFDLRRHGWSLLDLLEITPYVDAVEVFNARCPSMEMNQQAAEFAKEQHLAGTAGSDAHTVGEVGQATSLVPPFQNAEELRIVIQHSKVEGRLSSPFTHLASTYARIYKQLRGRP